LKQSSVYRALSVEAPGELDVHSFLFPLSAHPPHFEDSVTSFNMAYQACDTYFVESHDAYPARPSQDYTKMLGRRRQEAMADELSRQAAEAYIEDIHAHMKQLEVNHQDLTFSYDVLTIFTG
jgi:hypothetical protein